MPVPPRHPTTPSVQHPIALAGGELTDRRTVPVAVRLLFLHMSDRPHPTPLYYDQPASGRHEPIRIGDCMCAILEPRSLLSAYYNIGSLHSRRRRALLAWRMIFGCEHRLDHRRPELASPLLPYPSSSSPLPGGQHREGRAQFQSGYACNHGQSLGQTATSGIASTYRCNSADTQPWWWLWRNPSQLFLNTHGTLRVIVSALPAITTIVPQGRSRHAGTSKKGQV